MGRFSTLFVRLAVCAALFGIAGSAGAQEPQQPERRLELRDFERPLRDEGGSHTRWYGWETLAADTISLALVPFGFGVLSFLLATPITHVVHGRGGEGGASLVIRIFSAVLPAVLWLSNCFELNWGGGEGDTSDDTLCEVVLPVWGAVGVTGSMALDAAVFAYEQRARPPRFNVAPWATASGAGGMALRGRF